MDFGDTSRLMADEVVRDFHEDGAHIFAQRVDEAAAAALLEALRADRAYGADLFLSEAEFDADPQYRGVNPRPGRNLLETFADQLGFVEAAPHITAGLAALLGADYQLVDRKAVCGVPASAIPEWLKARIAGNPVNNLGPYVKPQFRDVTYFYGIDFHQDLIDFKGRDADFVTLYVYLHAVTDADAPLFLLQGSHALGAAVFPHDLTRTGPDTWLYRNGAREQGVRQQVLTGQAGYAAVWHACTLHGTQPDAADHERISLRYLFARGAADHAGIDAVNARLLGPIRLEDTRVDLDGEGAAQIKRNSVNGA
jgi:hypothetical protein